jgi:hypothetical protein
MAPFAWRGFIQAVITGALVLAASASLAQPASVPAKPDLRLVRAEVYVNGTDAFVRWRFEVANKAAYPAEMFVPSPGLPPCGSNPNAARTWVDFFDADERRIYGFCALAGSDQLATLWFSTPFDRLPPAGAYVVFTDRLTNTRYRSDLVDLRPEALVAQAAARRAAGDNSGAFRLLERAIFVQRHIGPVDTAWYDEALSLASGLTPN